MIKFKELASDAMPTATWLHVYNRNAYVFQNLRICRILPRVGVVPTPELGGDTTSPNPLERLTYRPTCVQP